MDLIVIYWCLDKLLNLDTLLIQIRHEVTPKWYQFGLAVGISKETLDEFSNFTPEECIVEVADLWLRTSVTTLTWRDVADALKGCGYHKLAEKILKVYKTGAHYYFELWVYNRFHVVNPMKVFYQ